MKYLNRENYNPHWLLTHTNGDALVNVSNFLDASVSESLKSKDIAIFRLLQNKRVRKLVDFDRLVFIRKQHSYAGSGTVFSRYPNNSLGRVNTRDYNHFVKETVFAIQGAIRQAVDGKFVVINLDFIAYSPQMQGGIPEKAYTDYRCNIYLCNADMVSATYLRKMYIDIALADS